MEELREELHNSIEIYDILDSKTIQVSQELNKLIVEHMKGEIAIDTMSYWQLSSR